MEPDVIGEDIDIIKAENEKLMEKIFTVLLAPRDLVDMELEIIADPYWLGMPNVMLIGKDQLLLTVSIWLVGHLISQRYQFALSRSFGFGYYIFHI